MKTVDNEIRDGWLGANLRSQNMHRRAQRSPKTTFIRSAPLHRLNPLSGRRAYSRRLARKSLEQGRSRSGPSASSVNDNVLYHSPHWIAHFDALGCRYCFDYLGLAHETESIPLTEYFPICRVPEYSECGWRTCSALGFH
jgi:hypothetical protein